MEKISIIVPVYNVEKYLKVCLDHLLAQTYENIEILLIDDGSKDNSGAICDEYASKDKRIRVVHKANGGAAECRNLGIEMAEGEYIVFVDSDDIVPKDYCRIMHDALKGDDCDIAICSYVRFSSEPVPEETGTGALKIVGSYDAIKNMYSAEGAAYIGPCGKIYKKEIMEGIKYPVGKIHEDDFTTYKYYLNAEKIALLDRGLYFYRVNENSVTTNPKYFERMELYEALDEREKILSEQKGMEELVALTNKAYLDRIIYRNRFLKKTNKAKVKELFSMYKVYYRRVKDKVPGIGYKIYYYCPAFYYFLVRVLKK